MKENKFDFYFKFVKYSIALGVISFIFVQIH